MSIVQSDSMSDATTGDESFADSAPSSIFSSSPRGPRRILVIGHRGVGKTSFLERVREYSKIENRKCLAIDLDEEIVRREKRTIADIFTVAGEAEFRRLEENTLISLVSEIDVNADIEAIESHHEGRLDGAIEYGINGENQDVFIATGAGYMGAVPEGWTCLWLRRPTDQVGRIFLDRPRLNSNISPLEEYELRHKEREQIYRMRADFELTIPEGLEAALLLREEADLIFDRGRDVGGALTILPNLFASEARTHQYFASRLSMGFDFFELRDDLLSPAQLEYALANLPSGKIIFSFRKPQAIALSARLSDEFKPALIDWAFELGEIPADLSPSIISFHSRDLPKLPTTSVTDGIDASLGQFFNYITQLEIVRDRLVKVAVAVHDFTELELGHRWFCEDRTRRSFLPSDQGQSQPQSQGKNQGMGKEQSHEVSPKNNQGRWAWYRLLMKRQLPLNFVREGDGSSFDQPVLLDWLRFQPGRTSFAAVLGDPVLQSRTPIEQFPFFNRASINTLAVQVSQIDWENGALEFLRLCGLRFAAVTSPLKELAFRDCRIRTEEAETLQSVNTLAWDGQSWCGDNTDRRGLILSVPDFANSMIPTVVWGGGGTLQMLTSILPHAHFFSARTGRERSTTHDINDPQSAEDGKYDSAGWNCRNPTMVVWAVGRKRWQEGKLSFPPVDWRPQTVVDLNYSEDSPGREYALNCGAKYLSGLPMFGHQAHLQRKFWVRYVG